MPTRKESLPVPLPSSQLSALRERAEQATPGPWTAHRAIHRSDYGIRCPLSDGIIAEFWAEAYRAGEVLPDVAKANAEFAAAANPAVILSLLDRLEALEQDQREIIQLRGLALELSQTLAKRCLSDANAEVGDSGEWPAGQEWDDLGGTSQSIMRRLMPPSTARKCPMPTRKESLPVPLPSSQLSALREIAEIELTRGDEANVIYVRPLTLLALLDRLEALEQDRERLDWLTAYPRADVPRRWKCVMEAWNGAHPNGGCISTESVREAIDAARQAGPEEEG